MVSLDIWTADIKEIEQVIKMRWNFTIKYDRNGNIKVSKNHNECNLQKLAIERLLNE